MEFELLGNGYIDVQFDENPSDGLVVPEAPDWLELSLGPTSQIREAEKILGCRKPGHYCRGEGNLEQVSIDGVEGKFYCPYLVKNDDGNCKT